VDESWSWEPNKHESNEYDHNNDHPKVLPESFLEIRAVDKYASQKYAKVATKNATESEVPPFKWDDGKALSGDATE